MIHHAPLLAVVLLVGPAAISADEPVYVWTEPPSQLRAKQWIAENAQHLAMRYPPSLALWKSQKQYSVSFVVTNHTDFVQGPCDDTPIKVTLEGGQPITLVPMKSTAACNRKSLAASLKSGYLMLTPDDMFRAIERSVGSATTSSPECIQAEFDNNTGIPTRLLGGCPGNADDGWKVEVAELRIHRASPNKSLERSRDR